MKSRFSTVDIAVIVQELKRFLGMRVVNVYDIDNKTYLIRIGKPDEKTVILMESGVRLHSTEFDWPKNPAPSGFSMKLRKHLKGRRFESIQQLGMDRIVDLQFGSGEAAYHIMLELYDRGNLALTDHEYTILTLLRPRTDASQDAKFAVRETYPFNVDKTHVPPTSERLREILGNGKEGDVLKKMLVPNLDYGPAIIDHALIGAGFPENVKLGKGFCLENDFDRLLSAILEAESLFMKLISEPCKGYIIQKKDKKPNPKPGEEEEILLYDEFHSYLYHQHENKPHGQFDKFDQAVDEFFSKLECQKLDMKVIQQEKGALKKLDNVRKDHEKRIEGLQKEQESDILRGQLIENNLNLVDQAILIVRNAVANQIDWTEIWTLVKEAQAAGDPVATAIKSLKLDSNQITLLLKYFDKKKQAAKKEQKTMEASKKAFKSAEKKTKQTLKDVATAASINKTRKTYWFEKFLWFISSENYLVIGGRDQQQNELVVKRYMRPGDLYVHADLHGASSCIVKNPAGGPVPPKTLNEAGTMAICNSAAWDSKVVTSAWWVYHDQVSKTAPSGEYLTTGSFMVRGRKNYLPPSYLIYGFGFLFKLEESSVERHLGERKVRTADTDTISVTDSITGLSSSQGDDEMELDISDASDDENEEDSVQSDDVEKLDSNLDEVIETDCVVEEKKENDTWAKAEPTLQGEEKPENAVKEKGIQKFQQNKKEREEKEIMFPDTNINLTHVKGDKYELQRDLTAASEASEVTDAFFLGDTTPVVLGEKTSEKQQPIGPAKRGQRAKKKKIKEKYADQDEDERQLRMEILASAGSQKEDKKKKGKKGKEPQSAGKKPQQSRPQSAGTGHSQAQSKVTFKAEENKLAENVQGLELNDAEGKDAAARQPKPSKKDEDADSDGEKEDDTNIAT
ncbi:nuclear export mediator factor Nemf-like, partial [Elysia marginata]